MPRAAPDAKPFPKAPFNVVIVAQSGRLQYEALIFMASLRLTNPDFAGTVYLAEPQPGPLWPDDPRITNTALRETLTELGGTFLPFENRHFGAPYPNGNKIELLKALPKGEPFVFFDTDTLVTGALADVPFDFDRPSASLRREGTWPEPQLYAAGYNEIWGALYDLMGLDFASSLDLSQPDEYWRRYLYFNAGFFYYRCPHAFGALYEKTALAIRDSRLPELAAQKLYPWLDQIALPLVIHALGGGRDTLAPGTLDGDVTCHYRFLPLLYARASDHAIAVIEEALAPQRIKRFMKNSDAAKRLIYQGRGHRVRALFDRQNLPRREAMIRNKIRSEGYWMR